MNCCAKNPTQHTYPGCTTTHTSIRAGPAGGAEDSLLKSPPVYRYAPAPAAAIAPTARKPCEATLSFTDAELIAQTADRCKLVDDQVKQALHLRTTSCLLLHSLAAEPGWKISGHSGPADEQCGRTSCNCFRQAARPCRSSDSSTKRCSSSL